MNSPLITKIHCSALPNWSTCEQYELHRMRHPDQTVRKGEHVATWMGTSIHARIAGDAEPNPPREVIFDKITPTIQVARSQINSMSEAIMRAMMEEGWHVMAQEYSPPGWMDPIGVPWIELVGRIDMRLEGPGGRSALIDLKTSKELRRSWLQLGGYWLMDNADVLGVLHCPRPTNILDDAKATFHYNEAPAESVGDMARRVLVRVSAILEDESIAIPAPGNRCRYCPNGACIVRSVGTSPV